MALRAARSAVKISSHRRHQPHRHLFTDQPLRPSAIAKTQDSRNWMQIYVAKFRRSEGMEGRPRTANLLKSGSNLSLWELTHSLCDVVWGGSSGWAIVKRWLMVNGVPYVIIGHVGRRCHVVA